jgi:glycosyltransferase involved in cell wall biosynthesis
MSEKIKVLTISDHPFSKSGIGIQMNQLITGLLDTGKYSFFSVGAGLKHQNTQIQKVEEYGDDWIVQPVEGFGDKNQMRQWLMGYDPDVVLFLSDPRFFIWGFEMEDEIRSRCPLVFWTVWDSDPAPKFNKPIYDCCDDIAWFSQHSHDFHVDNIDFDADAHCITLARDPELFYRESDEDLRKFKIQTLGFEHRDSFVALYVSRNARRKRPSDLMHSWRMFIDGLPEDEREKAVLVMHTDPSDHEGANLIHVLELLNLQNNVKFSSSKFNEDVMRKLYAMSDVTLNMSMNEGFGMSIHESFLCETPVICVKTGGMTEQMTDGTTTFGICLEPEIRTLVGSQLVPYIYEDLVSPETYAKAIREMYDMGSDARRELGSQGREFAKTKFTVDGIVSKFDEIFQKRVEEYREPERLRAQLLEI